VSLPFDQYRMIRLTVLRNQPYSVIIVVAVVTIMFRTDYLRVTNILTLSPGEVFAYHLLGDGGQNVAELFFNFMFHIS